MDNEVVGRSVRRWIEEESEDGEVVRCEKRGEAVLLFVEFPSASLSLPAAEFEEFLETGSFELLDELL